jgi:hypothetical protein
MGLLLESIYSIILSSKSRPTKILFLVFGCSLMRLLVFLTLNDGGTIKNVIIGALLLLTFFIGGCAGDDGKVDIYFYWAGKPTAFSDNNPATPNSASTLVEYQKYETSAGSYYLTYTSWYGTKYSTRYTIKVNEGTINPLLLIPMDGEDKHYSIYLSSYGPFASGDRSADEEVRYGNRESLKNQREVSADNSSIDYDFIQFEEFYEEKIIGDTKLILRYKKLNP